MGTSGEESGRIHIRKIRELAEKHTRRELAECIQSQLYEGASPCLAADSTEEAINVLAKAEYVRSLMDQGMPLATALRELGNRIRKAQENLGFEG